MCCQWTWVNAFEKKTVTMDDSWMLVIHEIRPKLVKTQQKNGKKNNPDNIEYFETDWREKKKREINGHTLSHVQQ